MMISTHVITVISVLIIQQGFREVICASRFTVFSRVDIMTGYECPAGHVLTGQGTSGVNYKMCAMQCSRLPTCHGIFHHPDTLQCVKCSAQYHTLSGTHVPTSGLLFYARNNNSVNNDPEVSVYMLTSRATWDGAKEKCKSLGGSLVIIRSADDRLYLVSMITATNNNFWIGGDGFPRERNFHWIDGTDVFSGYTYWNGNQPYHKAGGRTCMSMYRRWPHKWNDEACGNRRRVFCEFV